VTCRLASVALVVGAALADAAGSHALAYYALVAAVPAAAVAALSACGDVLDGTSVAPLDRRLAVLSSFAAPLVLLAAASRAPLVEGAPPPALGIAAVVACLALFAVQALLAASTVRARAPRTTLRPKSYPLRTAVSPPPSPRPRSAAGRGRTSRP
jgi:hypothetical protein